MGLLDSLARGSRRKLDLITHEKRRQTFVIFAASLHITRLYACTPARLHACTPAPCAACSG
ncbi:hypothetical protein M433DRAFT_153904 [Acidomyces richmondensis BFW]|nr:MAG: hypothetical protein FE78DRAFT_93781 [Acidomyces sp. 'richmondensis']KYG45984.1 hypothetical protein M433DRAFT_153904 [Acidomyces richmondensis BFW]